ncbi:hypothetical protein LCD43_25500 (plasmid) [Enterobacter asburiae]|uniref:hypothetical protein n=1 Tax=Enterobacter asburiae TaxID=61645 RepID=UPI002000B446|nr:hypothetical protein [Enterobacter asburiae]UOY54099.1 hypothetical protein LCD43_25500 [Enterobacter asburiae]
MPVKGIKRVQMNTRKVLSDIAGIRTEKVLYEVMNAGANHAALITPVAKTSVLINSQYKKLEPMPSGMIGRVGYAANYAAAVNAARGKLKGKPRPDGSGNYWDQMANRTSSAKALSATASTRLRPSSSKGTKYDA